MSTPIRAIIFDFDGLMIDTETPAFTAWAEIYRSHGVELALERWVDCVGAVSSPFDPVAHLGELTGRQHDRIELIAAKEAKKAAVCDELEPLPGVLARLTEAKKLGLAVAVASSSLGPWVRGHLTRTRLLPLVQIIRTREEVVHAKPAPDLYLSAAAGLGVEPADCIAFEDSLNGVRAAKAAGMRCYAVPNFVTKGLDFAAADGVLTGLDSVTLEQLIAASHRSLPTAAAAVPRP